MNNKTRFPLILGWLLIPYGVIYYLSLGGTSPGTLEKFTGVFKQWFLLICLLLFLGCIWVSTDQSSEMGKEQVKPLWLSWLTGLLLTLGIVLGLFIYINPHARFTSSRFPPVTTGARIIKIEQYKNLDIFPNIIILGSSRAFTLSPEYLEEQIGQKVFNMSVEGARGGDYAIQLEYILAQHSPPDVLVIEFSQASLPQGDYEYYYPSLQPVSLIPYIPLVPATHVMDETFRDAFGLQAISDSIYLLTLPDVQNQVRIWSFEEGGLGIRKPVNAKQYQAVLRNEIRRRIKTMHCRTFPSKTTKQAFEGFLKLAQENNIGIVLYESPMNVDFYDAAYQASPDKFEHCRRIVGSYLNSLTSTHPNVFIRDLSDYEKINDLREEGFYDTVHLRPIASEMVIDALLPDIQSALTWARESQKTNP